MVGFTFLSHNSLNSFKPLFAEILAKFHEAIKHGQLSLLQHVFASIIGPLKRDKLTLLGKELFVKP